MLRLCTLMFVLLAASPRYGLAAEPELFWVSSGLNNRDLTISPAGDLLFTTVMAPGNRFSVIVMSRKARGEWQPLEIAPFSGRYADIEPMFDPGGEKLYFASKRPRPGGPGDDWDIWITRYNGDHWSEPENLGAPVNSDANEFYPSAGTSGNLYFTAERAGSAGSEDIYMARYEDGHYVSVAPVGGGVNTKADEFNAFVAPDDRFILFSAAGREEELGGGDLYISQKDDKGQFGAARLLASPINSMSLEYCPFLFEGRMYFTSRRADRPDEVRSYRQLQQWLESPGNGMGDVYSVPVEMLKVGEF